MAYGTTREHLAHQEVASDSFAARLRAWRKRENLSQSEAALRLQISKRTLQEWEQNRAMPSGIARVAVESAISG